MLWPICKSKEVWSCQVRALEIQKTFEDVCSERNWWMNWTVYAVGSMLIGKPVARATSNICTVEESIFHFKTIIIEDGLSPSFRETVDLYDELLSDSATVEPSCAAKVINPIQSTLNLREQHRDVYNFFQNWTPCSKKNHSLPGQSTPQPCNRAGPTLKLGVSKQHVTWPQVKERPSVGARSDYCPNLLVPTSTVPCRR